MWHEANISATPLENIYRYLIHGDHCWNFEFYASEWILESTFFSILGLSEFLSMLLTIWPAGITFKLIYSGFSLCFETLNG